MSTFVIEADDPCLDGHFPGNPLVPGVVILDIAAHGLEQGAGAGSQSSGTVATPLIGNWPAPGTKVVGVVQAKFSSPLRPHEPLKIEYQPLQDGTVGFRCTSAGRNVAEGTFVVQRETPRDPS